MNWQQGFRCVVVLSSLSFFSPSLLAQNCSNNQAPVANAGPDRSGNVGISMSFSSQGSSDSDGVLNSYWFNFGDGQFTGWQSNPSVSHSFASAGTYSLRLWVKDNCNVFSAADTAVITITAGSNPCAGNTSPIVQLSVPSSGVVGQSLSFSAANSSDPGGSIASYAWNFGDGSSANGVSVSKSYTSSGNFTITLTLTDNCGASAMANASISISVANPCVGNTAPVANAGPDKQGNPNVAIDFSGSASSDANGNNTIQSYWFNFGDGSFTGWQSSASASHAFVNVGSYTVRLWVRDNCGAMSASDLALVSIAAPNACAGNTPPNAVITSPSSGLVNQSLNFSGLSSSDTTGTIQSYAWNFGDGQSGSGVNVSHSYTSAGNKTVTLTVSDSCGVQGQMTRTIVISNPDPCVENQSPVAQASANPASANINQAISFSALGSNDPNGSITSYAWNFGDGSSGSGLNASHTYASAGTFNVILTVTDNCGATAAKTISVSITNPNQGLVADFRVLKLTHVDAVSGEETWEDAGGFSANHPIELGLHIKLDGTISSGPAANYRWRTNGVLFATTPTVARTYTAPGPVEIQLTVYNADATQSNTITKTIHVARVMEFLDALPWSPGESTGLAVDGNYGWTSHMTNMMKTLDLSDPANNQVLGTLQTPAGRAIAAGDGYVYLCTYGNSIYIYDQDDLLANPNGTGSNPPQARVFNSGGSFRVVAARGLAFITAESNGLRIIKPMPNGPPIEMGYFLLPPGRSARAIAVNEHTAYVSDQIGRVYGIDISGVTASASPAGLLASRFVITLGGPIRHISNEDSTVAFAYDNGVYLYKHLPSSNELILGSYTELMDAYGGGTTATSVLLYQNRLYVGFGPYAEYLDVDGESIARFDVTNASSPYILEALWVENYGTGYPANPVVRDDVIFWTGLYKPAFAVRVSQP